MKTLFDIPGSVDRSAEISDCQQYRWWLRRSWTNWDKNGIAVPGKGVCCFVMLNPSTADATIDDPTIRRCVGFAKTWGYTILSVRNLFAFRATNPAELLFTENPTGGERGDLELLAACTADITVVAWGAGVVGNRDKVALALFAKHFPRHPLYCLGTTKNGYPRHPLYVRADQQLVRFNAPNKETNTQKGGES